MKTVALILAGGSSSRMNGVNKQFALIGGVPVIAASALAFQKSPLISEIVIAARECDADRVIRVCAGYGIDKLKTVVPGGNSRTESARLAFSAADAAPDDIIMVHDGARPYVSAELISRVHAECVGYGAAVPAVPVKDTIKFEDGTGFAAGTPDRASLRAVQTPQAFRAGLYGRMISQEYDATDDAGLAERLGVKVKLTAGDTKNIKITTPDDLPKENKMLRIGHGYYVHLLAEGRKLIIGGTEIPYELGLLGHSDADVLVHAVMDAMLGALALGDIGQHFPDSDPRYKGADSIELLKQVTALINERGYTVSNLDCTINAERPKLAPYIPAMRNSIAAACGVPADRVSVKATTEEGLGLAGKGIGAVCVCLLCGK